MELLVTEMSHVPTRYEIQPLTFWKILVYWIFQDQNNNKTKHKDVFQQFEFVSKNLATQNPRRDNSTPSVSTGVTGL